MQARLTDQAAVAVALARRAGGSQPTAAHLLIGLVTEPEGRAGRRLRERASAAAALVDRAGAVPAPSLEVVLRQALQAAGARAATTVDLLDAVIAAGGGDVAGFLERAGYQRDLDGWLAADPYAEWYEDAETYGLAPHGDALLDRSASRVVAQVRAVNGGAVEVLIAGTAAPDSPLAAPDPRALAATAARLRSAAPQWDAGLDAVLTAAQTLREDDLVTIRDLVRAALAAGGDGPRLVLQFASTSAGELP